MTTMPIPTRVRRTALALAVLVAGACGEESYAPDEPPFALLDPRVSRDSAFVAPDTVPANERFEVSVPIITTICAQPGRTALSIAGTIATVTFYDDERCGIPDQTVSYRRRTATVLLALPGTVTLRARLADRDGLVVLERTVVVR